MGDMENTTSLRHADGLGSVLRTSPAMRAMFERSVLPGGPRVISARLPGTRSLSVAVHVPVGSRHEDGPDAGLAFARQPYAVAFVDALPRNATGKVHKPTLRERFGQAPAKAK